MAEYRMAERQYAKGIMANDPKVIEFLQYLGLTLEGLTEVVITIEVQKPIIVTETHKARGRVIEG